MPSTKMFRDRVVSMEQTFEKGEKHLPLLKALVDEAIPGMELEEYVLDHEHDCFVMIYKTASGGRKRISWTRMVLYDAERIPAIVENAQAEIRLRLLDYLKRRSDRPVIDVTFRHLEEGWVDTPEPRKSKPQPQRGKPQPPGGRPSGAPAGPPSRGRGGMPRPSQQPGGRPGGPSGPPQGRPPRTQRPGPGVPAPSGSPAPPAAAGAPAGAPGTPVPGAGGRRRRFRRRRGRRRGGPATGGGAPPAPGGGGSP
jgi:hypothetical protein